MLGKRRRKQTSLKALTIKRLQANGYVACDAERVIPAASGPVKLDLFGFADVIAAHPQRLGTLYVQVCRRQDVLDRARKMFERRAEVLSSLLQAQNVVQVHGWFDYRPVRAAKVAAYDVQRHLIESDNFTDYRLDLYCRTTLTVVLRRRLSKRRDIEL